MAHTHASILHYNGAYVSAPNENLLHYAVDDVILPVFAADTGVNWRLRCHRANNIALSACSIAFLSLILMQANASHGFSHAACVIMAAIYACSKLQIITCYRIGCRKLLSIRMPIYGT